MPRRNYPPLPRHRRHTAPQRFKAKGRKRGSHWHMKAEDEEWARTQEAWTAAGVTEPVAEVDYTGAAPAQVFRHDSAPVHLGAK